MSTELKEQDLDRLSELTVALLSAKKDKAEQDLIKNKIMDFFRTNKIKTYRYKDLYIHFTDTRETKEFDPNLLRDKYPAIWEECHSVNVRPPHLQIKKVAPEKDELPTEEELAEGEA